MLKREDFGSQAMFGKDWILVLKESSLDCTNNALF